jgi:hypothetical protein
MMMMRRIRRMTQLRRFERRATGEAEKQRTLHLTSEQSTMSYCYYLGVHSLELLNLQWVQIVQQRLQLMRIVEEEVVGQNHLAVMATAQLKMKQQSTSIQMILVMGQQR